MILYRTFIQPNDEFSMRSLSMESIRELSSYLQALEVKKIIKRGGYMVTTISLSIEFIITRVMNIKENSEF